jgi:hypothetical protein
MSCEERQRAGKSEETKSREGEKQSVQKGKLSSTYKYTHSLSLSDAKFNQDLLVPKSFISFMSDPHPSHGFKHIFTLRGSSLPSIVTITTAAHTRKMAQKLRLVVTRAEAWR